MLDANKARDDLKDILKTHEYQIYYNQSKSLLATLWDKAKEWIAKQLLKLFPALESAGSAAGPILIIIITLVLILFGFCIFLLIRSNRRKHKFKERMPLQSINEINWTYQRHLEEAKKQEDLEEYTRSTRHLFLALLLYFHEKGSLEARIWKTNWDYYEELKKINPPFAQQFLNLSSFFEEATYGERNVQKVEYVSFSATVMSWLEDDEGGLVRSK